MIQSLVMDQAPRAVTWLAPEHNHSEKGGDWFFAFTIIVIAVVLAAVLLGNSLFALVLAVAGLALAISAVKRPLTIPYEITVRGIKINDEFHPYASLASYYIDEDDAPGPQLLLRSNRKFTPLIVLTIPSEYVDDVEDILRDKLPEEHLEEPLFLKVLEKFGF